MSNANPTQSADDQLLDEYWRALGKFVSKFSMLEAVMQFYLWRSANVTPQIARAIFSGVKTEQAKGFVMRILEAKGLKPSALVSEAFTQMAALNEARNLILHHGANFRDGQLIASNMLIAHSERSLKELRVSPQLLDDMSHDVATIATTLAHEMVQDAYSSAITAGAVLQPYEPSAWRYKRTVESRTQKQNPNNSVKPPRPPKSSRK